MYTLRYAIGAADQMPRDRRFKKIYPFYIATVNYRPRSLLLLLCCTIKISCSSIKSPDNSFSIIVLGSKVFLKLL